MLKRRRNSVLYRMNILWNKTAIALIKSIWQIRHWQNLCDFSNMRIFWNIKKWTVCFFIILKIIWCYQMFNTSPSRPNPRRREKINLNFYFRPSLWCLKRFYEGLYGLHKTFWGTTSVKINIKLVFSIRQGKAGKG